MTSKPTTMQELALSFSLDLVRQRDLAITQLIGRLAREGHRGWVEVVRDDPYWDDEDRCVRWPLRYRKHEDDFEVGDAPSIDAVVPSDYYSLRNVGSA
jgi:hypothetical protein